MSKSSQGFYLADLLELLSQPFCDAYLVLYKWLCAWFILCLVFEVLDFNDFQLNSFS